MVDYVLVLRSSGTYINHCIRGKYYRNYLYQNLLNIDQSFKNYLRRDRCKHVYFTVGLTVSYARTFQSSDQ